MIWPWALPAFLAIPYWVMFAVTWRSLTGHMAWAVHRSADKAKTIRPPIENWVASSVPCAVLALLWPAVLLFTIRWPKSLTRGDERTAETYLKDMEFTQLCESNDRKYEQLVSGEVVE